MTLLRNIVIKCKNRTGKIKRRIKGVCNIVSSAKGCWFGRDGDSVTFRQGRRIQLFLLEAIRQGLLNGDI
jgi:hypothetical protein